MLENYVNNIKLKLMEVESDEKIACTRRHKNRLAPSTEHPHPKPHTLPPREERGIYTLAAFTPYR